MSDRALKRLVGALVVVLAMWGVASLLSGDGGGGIGATGEITTVLEGVERESITSVRVSSISGETELTGTPGQWLVNGFRADSAITARFMELLERMKVGDLVAANPENHARMEIGDDEAWSLDISLGDDTRSLLVGAQGPRFATTYVRLPGADEVYLLEADIRAHMRRPLNEWRNKRFVAVDTAVVARIEVENGADRFTFVRGDSAWSFEGGAPVAPLAVSDLLADLRGFDSSGILDDEAIAGEPQAARTVAYDASGAVLADLTVGEGSGDRWTRAAGDSTVYRLPTFRMTRLFPTLEKATPNEEGGTG